MESGKFRVGAIVPAAGKGRRMGGILSKQFLALDGKPILVRTLERLQASPLIDLVVVVVPVALLAEARLLVQRSELTKISDVIPGGEERQDSVGCGLDVLTVYNPRYVLVHDGVRPLVDDDLIDRVLSAAIRSGAAIPAIRAKETMKMVDASGCVRETVPRELLWIAQTPQAFEFNLLRRAYVAARASGFSGTDDASLVERLGEKVSIVEGNCDNIKITTPQDLEFASSILRRKL